jgi:hypothetical protein
MPAPLVNLNPISLCGRVHIYDNCTLSLTKKILHPPRRYNDIRLANEKMRIYIGASDVKFDLLLSFATLKSMHTNATGHGDTQVVSDGA